MFLNFSSNGCTCVLCVLLVALLSANASHVRMIYNIRRCELWSLDSDGVSILQLREVHASWPCDRLEVCTLYSAGGGVIQ